MYIDTYTGEWFWNTQINCNRCQYTFENCWFYRVLYCILHQSSVCISYNGQIFCFRQWDTSVILFFTTHQKTEDCWWNKLESVKYFIAFYICDSTFFPQQIKTVSIHLQLDCRVFIADNLTPCSCGQKEIRNDSYERETRGFKIPQNAISEGMFFFFPQGASVE